MNAMANAATSDRHAQRIVNIVIFIKVKDETAFTFTVDRQLDAYNLIYTL